MLKVPSADEISKLTLLDKELMIRFLLILKKINLAGNNARLYLRRLQQEVDAYHQSLGTDPDTLIKAVSALMEKHLYLQTILIEHRRKIRRQQEMLK